MTGEKETKAEKDGDFMGIDVNREMCEDPQVKVL